MCALCAGDSLVTRTASGNPHASMWSLVLLALFFGLGQNIVKPIIAPQAIALGGNALDAGVVAAAQGIGGLLVALPVGGLLARLGGRRVVGVGSVVFAAGAGVMAFAPNPELLALGHFLLGAGGVGAWLAAQTMATMAASDDASRRKIARVSTAALIGMLGGPLLGGLLTDLVGVEFAFLTSLLMGLLLLPVAIVLPRGSRISAVEKQQAPRVSRASRLLDTHLWRRPDLLAALLTSSVAQALLTIRQSFLPLHLEAGGWSSTQIGAVLSVAGIGALGARGAFTVLDRRFRTPVLMALCTLPGALSLGIAASSHAAGVVVTSVLVSGFALGLSQPLTLLMLARVTSDAERGPAVGQRIAGNRLMQAVAPAVFGGLASWIGLLAAFWIIALVCAGGGVLLSFRRSGR